MWRPIGPTRVSVTGRSLLAALRLDLAAGITPALAGGGVLLYGLIQVGYCFQLKQLPLLDPLDAEVAAAGGRLDLAKDSRQSAALFQPCSADRMAALRSG